MSSKKCTKSPQDNILCCPICMDIYKVPRMLPCQHTLCETCLHSYIVNKSRERVLVSDFPCPVCRTSTPAPRAFTRIDTWASLFPLNHLLVSLLDSSFHDLLEKKETAPAVTTERCSDHSGKHVEFYCIEHNAKLCSKCFKNTHRQCEVLDIEEHVEFTSRFNALKNNSDNIRTYLNETIGHLRSNIDQLHFQKNSILTEVKDFRGKVESILNSIEEDIKGQVDEQHDSEVAVLTAQCEEYERIRSEIDRSEKTLNELPLPGNIAQSLEQIASFENEIKDQLSFIQRCHANIKLVRLEYAVESKLLMFLNSVQQLGIVSANRIESCLRDPPELVVKEGSLSEYMIPSRDTSVTSEEVPESPMSPEVMFVTRTMVQPQPLPQAQLIVQASAQGSVDQMAASQTLPGNRQEHKTKDQKRPKTVPIETNTPTPVVRPRPERPNMCGIPSFLPTLCSTPVYQANRPTTLQSAQRHSTAICAETDMRDFENITPISSAFNNVNLCCTTTLTSSTPSFEKLDHHGNQYANTCNHHGGTNVTRQNSANGVDETAECEAFRRQCVRRSLSASSINTEADTPSHPNLSILNMQLTNVSPVYENASISSLEHVSAGERCSTFITLPSNSGRNQFKYCSRFKDFVVKIDNDVRECTVTGSVEMPDKRLILVDCNNSKVKLFSNELKFMCHLELKKEPWNVTNLMGNDIAVTVPLEKKIFVVSVGQSMQIQRCIKTRKECWGIAYLDKKFLITTKDDGNEVTFLDDNGREIRIVSFASRENPNILRPVSISLMTKEDVIYVCCEGQTGTKGSLVRMSSSGDILYVFTHKDLDRPYCVASYTGNEIFVAAIRSSNVLMLMEGGASVATVLSRDLGLNRPQHIHVTDWEGKTVLILTERRSDTANVFCLKR